MGPGPAAAPAAAGGPLVLAALGGWAAVWDPAHRTEYFCAFLATTTCQSLQSKLSESAEQVVGASRASCQRLQQKSSEYK